MSSDLRSTYHVYSPDAREVLEITNSGQRKSSICQASVYLFSLTTLCCLFLGLVTGKIVAGVAALILLSSMVYWCLRQIFSPKYLYVAMTGSGQLYLTIINPTLGNKNGQPGWYNLDSAPSEAEPYHLVGAILELKGRHTFGHYPQRVLLPTGHTSWLIKDSSDINAIVLQYGLNGPRTGALSPQEAWYVVNFCHSYEGYAAQREYGTFILPFLLLAITQTLKGNAPDTRVWRNLSSQATAIYHTIETLVDQPSLVTNCVTAGGLEQHQRFLLKQVITMLNGHLTELGQAKRSASLVEAEASARDPKQ